MLFYSKYSVFRQMMSKTRHILYEVFAESFPELESTVNGMTFLPRAIARRPNGPHIPLHKQKLRTNECGRQT